MNVLLCARMRLWASHAFLLEGLVPTAAICHIPPRREHKRLVTKSWNFQKGRFDITGSKEALKSSQTYPPDFGRTIVRGIIMQLLVLDVRNPSILYISLFSTAGQKLRATPACAERTLPKSNEETVVGSSSET